MKIIVFAVFLLALALPVTVSADEAASVTREAEGLDAFPLGKILPQLVAAGYSGNEHLHYDVSWSGGVKAGELDMKITALDDVKDGYKIDVHVTTKGSLIDLAYPIRDRHITLLKGAEKLPFRSDLWQKEGRSYRAHREMIYDQEKHRVVYFKNGKQQGDWHLKGPANNEFTSFLNSRLMDFVVNKPFIVPTFADKKRVAVKVTPLKKEKMETLLGKVNTVVIMPRLTFKGLYEKQGDTVIWYTADHCRVPVQVNSKIKIGSLTARLSGYENPACDLYPGRYEQNTRPYKRKESMK
ncbi:DUF3108 domain-containing protein [Desulforhopalus vacuolatus]|uniref:DUF3108 domain-containing protein n=1 Tax=Desulforhopalus vacuolatus TaxID=40414 RepID=UPI001964CB53|nr:DUF3108 domain-containing protein [Desulforhopalus vacuolatus]MBM9520676.1 DUF3108 domain-containing protein [Desulforhopalus vacuolatus]